MSYVLVKLMYLFINMHMALHACITQDLALHVITLFLLLRFSCDTGLKVSDCGNLGLLDITEIIRVRGALYWGVD